MEDRGVTHSDPAEPAAAPDSPAESPEADGVAAEVRELARERDDFKDRLLRKQAEFENYRKRTERERAEFAQYAAAELMTEILNVIDSLELALRDADAGEARTESLRRGFELIYKQLLDSLKRHGLERVESEGRPFDPHIHQAVGTQPTSEFPEGVVASELRRGYLLNGRLLRPAMVTVAAPPGKAAGE